jgi:hypothetical protein
MRERRFSVFFGIVIPETLQVIVCISVVGIPSCLRQFKLQHDKFKCMTTYELEIFCNVGVLWPIGTLFLPEIGKGDMCSGDLQGCFKTFNIFVDQSSLCWIHSWEIIRRVKDSGSTRLDAE